MKKIYNIFCGLLILILLSVGVVSLFDKDPTFSQTENRNLRTFPRITLSNLIDGSFTTALQEYYSDTFPGRENLMDDHKRLNAFYYYSGLSGDNSEQLVINYDSDAAQHGQSLNNPQETDPSGAMTQEGTSEPTEGIIPNITEPSAKTEQLGNLILVGDRAMDVPVANGDQIRSYAAAVNALAGLLGSDVQTICMPVPNAAAFYSSQEYRTGSRDQKAMFDLVRDQLDSNVKFIDAYTTLAQHMDEYLYFRTDHHWTHLGAYYAYTALCDAVGFTAQPRSKFETGSHESFVGSMYTYLANYAQSSVLKNNPDTLDYWKPYANCETYYYSDTELTNGVLMGTICRVNEQESNK